MLQGLCQIADRRYCYGMDGLFVYVSDDLVAASVQRLVTHYGYDAVCRVGAQYDSGLYAPDDVLCVGAPPMDGAVSAQVFDYPLRVGAILDRIEAVIVAREANVIVPIGGQYQLHAGEHRLISAAGGASIKVTDTEKRLLMVLAAAGAAGMSRDALLREVWGMRPDLDTHTVETHVYRLRQKIEVDPSAPALIMTRDDGYRLGGV